jgi:hypothetical protein
VQAKVVLRKKGKKVDYYCKVSGFAHSNNMGNAISFSLKTRLFLSFGVFFLWVIHYSHYSFPNFFFIFVIGG